MALTWILDGSHQSFYLHNILRSNEMKDYSIENSISAIYSDKTRDYFREVSSSYYNDNFRAAVVTLYSVVINDIIIKLEILRDLYEDQSADSILDEINQIQKKNPKNSDWEKKLVDLTHEKTSLLDQADYNHIQALLNDRNLCAHPVIDKEEKLFTPNKETVSSHIRNMLEALFLKAPILSRKITKTILEDVSKLKEILVEQDSFNKYIKSKYLDKLPSSTEVSIFRDIWKLVFNLRSEDCDNNRYVNFKLLELLYSRNIRMCKKKIQSDKDYFSNIANDGFISRYLILFLSENEYLFN